MSTFTHAAIAADSPLTVEAGAKIAEAGGNAVDIAIAAALAATLSEMLMCSLGGSGFIMVQVPGQDPELIDGADGMPSGHLKSSENADWWEAHLPYGDGIDVRGGRAAIAVPGMLAALEMAWRRHGSLPWKELVAPALELANGFPMGKTTAMWLDIAGPPLFYRQPASRECFGSDRGEEPREGKWCRIPGMADTLEAIASEGAKALYEGDIAAAFVREMADGGGFVTRSDLANYRAIARKPLMLNSGGFQLALNPLPAIGGVALGSLIRLAELDWSPENTEAERSLQQARAQLCLFRLREVDFKTPDFDDRRVQVLLERDALRTYLDALDSPHTTHLSVVTDSGAMVAMTLSNGYGSGITIPGTGIPCNNSLGEPELNPQGFLSAPPGSRLVSNMVPTLARHPDGRAIAFGTPGASRITTSMAQMWVRYALEGKSLDEAIAAPRLHVKLDVDPPAILCEAGLDTRLLERQFPIRRFDRPDMFFGGIKLAGIDGNGELHAIADLRRQGAIAITAPP